MQYKPGDRLSLNSAATLFAQRDMRPGDTPRSAIDRWRNRISNAAKTGTLPVEDGLYRIEVLAGWARGLSVKERSGWAQSLADLPAAPSVGYMNAVLPALKLEAFCHAVPLTLSDAHQEVSRLWLKIYELQKENRLLQEQLSFYQPIAERHLANNLKKGRRSPKE